MNTGELASIARDAALAGGALAAQRRAEGVEVAASKSSPEDVVTRADRETESLIRSMLADARPHDGFLGEESTGTAGTSGLTWVVDPIDGTVNYLYGRPHYGVSVAVVEGEPDPATWTTIAGAVLNPGNGDLFTAAKGSGAFLRDRQLRVKDAELSLALVATGFGYLAETRRIQALIVAGLISRIRDIRRAGVSSLDLCDVACGRVDAYFERGLNPWDHAAGALIATEAGASVIGFRGAPAGADFLLAAAPALAENLERALAPLLNEYYEWHE